jgi:hypothetical protein
VIYFNGRRIEREMMHPDIKPLFWQFNPADVADLILARDVHPILCSKNEIDGLRGELERFEENLY